MLKLINISNSQDIVRDAEIINSLRSLRMLVASELRMQYSDISLMVHSIKTHDIPYVIFTKYYKNLSLRSFLFHFKTFKMKLRTNLRSPIGSPKSIEEAGSDTLRPDRMSTQCNTVRTPISLTLRESSTPSLRIETEFGRIRRINDGFKHKKKNDRDKEAQILISSTGISYPLDSQQSPFKNEPQGEEFLHAIGYLSSKNPRKLPTDFDSLREIATRQREIPKSPGSKREVFSFPEKSELGMPAGRRDAQVLGAWLDSMLSKILNSTPGNPSSIQESAKVIYTVCFNEIVRQVSVNCVERGQLMDKVWNGYISLLEKAIVYSEKKQNKLLDKFKREKENITSYLNSIISKLRKENAELSDKNSNLSQELNLEHQRLHEIQDKESQFSNKLKVLEHAYKSANKQLFIYKEDRRILLERIQNLDRIQLIEKPEVENIMKRDSLHNNISQGLNREIFDVIGLLKDNGKL
jgi:hypothetical protein